MIRSYSSEQKAAVLAALLAGQSVSAVAREYKIPPGTVKSWKSRLNNGSDVASVATQKKAEVGDLLLAYLRANLEALEVQAQFFKNESWLAKQNAADLAVLHGVTTDKAIRLLEAMNHGVGTV